MRRRGRVFLFALLAGVWPLGACVYYNGMYNTNRLANSARKAERDGRTFEARSLWGQVITRADSLVARHPRSKYAGQAKVIRGLALARLEQCPAAVEPLAGPSLPDPSSDLAEEAALALGRCQLELGDAALADLAFAGVIDSRDPARRREARFYHARALRIAGRYREALPFLHENPDPRGGSDLLLALAGTGQRVAALALADSLLAANDTAFAWDSVIVGVGRQDPRAASALVTRLHGDRRLTPELRARRLYEDALRLADVDTAASLRRLHEAGDVNGETESGARARLSLVRLALREARSLDDLAPRADSLAALVARASGSAAEAAELETAVGRVRRLADSAGAGSPQADLRLFLGAEDARDALGARALAAGLFRRVADEWALSPYAPKAILAAEQLDPTDLEAARGRLDSLYADSPYMAMLRGEEAPGYQALEDSLATFATAQVPGVRQPRPGVRRARRPIIDEDEPRRRPRAPRPEGELTPGTRRGLEQ